MLRGNERQLYRSKCSKCGKEIIVSFDPAKTTERQILCKEDYERYMVEADLLVKDPLPQD